MTKLNKIRALALALLCGSASAGELSHDEALKLRKAGKLLPFEAVMQLVSQRHPDSQILEVELDDEDGQLIYEIEILTTEGTVREIELDAASGEVFEDELED